MDSQASQQYFSIAELVTQANNDLPRTIEPITERAIRHYISLGLVSSGLKVTQLPDEVGATLNHRGNKRFFIKSDVETVISVKQAITNGKSLDELGTYSGVPRSARQDVFEYVAYSRSFDTGEIISRDELRLPTIQDSWTVELRSDLFLQGTGPRPTMENLRDLSEFIEGNFAPSRPQRNHWDAEEEDLKVGALTIEIELSDICAPFSGIIVNASNAEVLPGGGVAGRIWEICGHEELMYERSKLDARWLPLSAGEAVFTEAGLGQSLGFTGIIHAYGPRWTSPVDKEKMSKGKRQVALHGEEDALIRAWQSVLRLADEHGETDLAAPAISSGIFGYPTPDNFDVAFTTLLSTPSKVRRVHMRTVSKRSFEQMIEARHRAKRKLGLA